MTARLGLFARGLGLWVLIALVFATQGYVSRVVANVPITVLDQLRGEAFVFGPWVLLWPIAFAAARRFPVEGPARLRNLLALLGVCACIAFAHVVLAVIGMTLAGLSPREWGAFVMRVRLTLPRAFGSHLAVSGGIVAVAHALAFRRAEERRALRESQLEATLARAELGLLRMQLHPHFLFNTLHAISALMSRDVPSARRMIAGLSELLRLSLEGDGAEQVPLSAEIEHLEHYVSIQKMRFLDRLAVEIEIDPEARGARVPKLVLQPLVENAIRHGIEPRAAPGRVRVEARRRGDRLHISVVDDGVGLPAGRPAREGVGLGNTRARLERLYGKDHAFTIEGRPGGGAAIALDLPFTTRDAGEERGCESAR